MGPTLVRGLALVVLSTVAAAQAGGVHVNHKQADAALVRGGTVITTPQLRAAVGHLGKPGPVDTQKDATTILYVTEGGGELVAGGHHQTVTKGDVVVVPAAASQSFRTLSPSISFLRITVPVLASDARPEFVHVPHDKVAATMKKAGPLADGPNLRVSGGYRTGPYAPADYRPDVEIHSNEADFFFIVEGRATQVLGGTIVGSRDTAPGQIRGSKIDGGQTYRLAKGDLMWVPKGLPHWFPDIPEPLSYLLVKVFY